MILPRPLRLREDVVRLARRRARIVAVAAALAALACAVPARILVGLERESAAWARATPVSAARVHAQRTDMGPFTTYRASARVGRGDEERVVDLGGLTVIGSIDLEAMEVRRDPETGAVMFASFVRAAPRRASAAWAALSLLGLGALALAGLAWRRRRDLSDLHAITSGPNELVARMRDLRRGRAELELDGTRTEAGYRDHAAARDVVRVSWREDESPPLWIGRDATHAIVVAASSGRARVVLREDFAPFALDPTDERAARARLAELTARLAASPPG